MIWNKFCSTNNDVLFFQKVNHYELRGIGKEGAVADFTSFDVHTGAESVSLPNTKLTLFIVVSQLPVVRSEQVGTIFFRKYSISRILT